LVTGLVQDLVQDLARRPFRTTKPFVRAQSATGQIVTKKKRLQNKNTVHGHKMHLDKFFLSHHPREIKEGKIK
jgi:hypothetical protein